jgi:hypothetical protein
MDETYQTLVYNLRGGGKMAVQSAGILEFAGGEIAGDDLRRLLVSEWNEVVVINFSANISVLPESNLPRNARVVTIVGSVAASQASIYLTSVSAGREMYLRLVGDLAGTFTNDNTSLAVIPSGCIILDSLGGAMASFTMHTSGASDCGVLLKAVADNTWAIVGEIGTNLVES